MKICPFIFGLVGFVTANSFGITCKDNPGIQCATADCTQTIKRALCPETCNLCNKINEMTCRDNGNFCDVMSCSSPSAQVMCAKSCNLCGNAAPTVSPTVSSQVECVDKNKNCHTNLCGHAFGQHQCPKTCNPKCQIKTTRAPYTRAPRPTKPPRTPKPPKIAKNIVENSPCQDNPMYKSMCGSALMKCDKTIGQAKMFCMRSCGLCVSIDEMFICKDARPDLCHMINCDNYLAGQYCAKSCNKCLKPHHMRQAAKTTTKAVKTTRKTTTRRTTTRKPKRKVTMITQASQATTKATSMMTQAECKDDPSYATICKDPSLDCSNILVTTVCRKSCYVCSGQKSAGMVTPITTFVTTTMRTLMTRAKTKCTLHDISYLQCDHECKVRDGQAYCACWSGFETDGSKCTKSETTEKCIADPSSECKVTNRSLQKLHVEIYNPAVPSRKCFGTLVSSILVVGIMDCVNRLGSSSLSVGIIRSEYPDVVVTTQRAEVARVQFSANLALIKILDTLETESEPCYSSAFKPSNETKCFSVGFGSARDAYFTKVAQIQLNFDGSRDCGPRSGEMCAKSNENRLTDLDLGSIVACQFCSTCTLYQYGILVKFGENDITVRSFNAVNNQLSLPIKSQGAKCTSTSTTTTSNILTTVSAVPSSQTTTQNMQMTTSLSTTKSVASTSSQRAEVTQCCFLTKIASNSQQMQFIQIDKTHNSHPVYYDSEKSVYLWYAEYKTTYIWIVTPTVSDRKNAVFIGNSAESCPDWVTDWLTWRNKWVAHETSFECLLEANPDNGNWLEWSPWSPCSFKKCDGTETRSRVRLCSGEDCPGSSSQQEVCSTEDCEKLKTACCRQIETTFEVNGNIAFFEFDRILDNKIVYREKNYHDMFLYNVGDHWEIGKGLLQKSVFHKSQTFHADCPTRTGLQWLSTNDTLVEGRVICSSTSQGWTEWSSCLELCQKGSAEATRKRTCSEVKLKDNDFASCQNPLVQQRPCDCQNFAKLIEMDQKCCTTFDIKYKDSVFNGVFYKYLENEQVYYRSKSDFYLFWSEENFAWVVTQKEMSEMAQVLLKLHGSKDCFLERNTENRRKRSSPYISNQFKDGLWKRFNLKDLRWENLNQDEVAVRCI